MPKRVLSGSVVAISGQQTISVLVVRWSTHPLYDKPAKSRKKYKAHVEDVAKYSVGDSVKIIESRPISKTKRWRVVEG